MEETEMFIQGDLQAVFDALYLIGAIDPVLKADWEKLSADLTQNSTLVGEAVSKLNSCDGNVDELKTALLGLEPKAVQFVALEVARELAEFSSREIVH